MTVRMPRSAFGRGMATRAPRDTLDYEIAQEQAFTLGRLGRQLEAALAALTAFDAARAGEPDATAANTRTALVAEAGVALWYFIVQRESLGLRDSARVLRDYRVPKDVYASMGAFPPKPPIGR